MGITRGLITLVLLVAFLALVAWLYSSRNKHRFDAIARLPLENDSGSEPLTPTLSATAPGVALPPASMQSSHKRRGVVRQEHMQ